MKIDETTRKKALLLLLVIIIAMLIPRVTYAEDGTVMYEAMLYSYTELNTLWTQDHRIGRLIGTEIRILGNTVYSDVEFFPSNTDQVLSPAE